jgi:hypothetical protein
MTEGSLVDADMPSRELIRALRIGGTADADVMPESVVWQSYIELQRRGHDGATDLFLGALRNLHSRRSIAGSSLNSNDVLVEEHRLTNDGMLSELWKAYKKCIRSHRTGPAGQLLKDIEQHLQR